MGDYISRAKAIFALSTITMYKSSIPYNTAVMRIKQLPPAQPEQLEQCPIYGGMCAYPSDQCHDCPRHAGAKMEVAE